MGIRVLSGAAANRMPKAYRFGATAVSAMALAALVPQAAFAQDAPADESASDGSEIVVGAQWMSREDAAHALCEPLQFLDPQSKRSFALITTRKA